ncbi:MAG: hypothetical protein GY816_13255 [Cytophagales bacterium]|nr:hypothetical protein [Cytophagales bacterium]
MTEIRKTSFSTNIKVISSGLFAWTLFVFSLLKLSIIYTSNPEVSFLITYEVSGIVFLLYFYVYLKNRFSLWYFFSLVVLFNTSIYLLSLIYDVLILLKVSGLNPYLFLVASVINVVCAVITYSILMAISKRSRR